MKVTRINQDGSMNDIKISSVKKNIIKNLNNSSIKKGSTDLKEIYKWLVDSKEIYCYGWFDGDPGFENKHDLIPNGNSSFLDEDSSTILLYGDMFILAQDTKTKKFIDFCVSDYAAVYEILFENFDDCNTDEEGPEESEEEEELEEDKQFINDNSDLSEEEYSDIELDIDENNYTLDD